MADTIPQAAFSEVENIRLSSSPDISFPEVEAWPNIVQGLIHMIMITVIAELWYARVAAEVKRLIVAYNFLRR